MRNTQHKGEETEVRHRQKAVPFDKLYGVVMLWRESYTMKTMIAACLPHRWWKFHALALTSYSQRPLGVTCPIFSDDAFYVEAGIHHGIAAVKPEFFYGDDSVEAAVLSQLKKQHKAESPFSSRSGKLLLNPY